MRIDKKTFHISMIDLHNSTVLIHPEQVDTTKGKDVIIGNKKIIIVDELMKINDVKESMKINDVKESMKITKALTLKGQISKSRTSEGPIQ
jgi:hypothetical protein